MNTEQIRQRLEDERQELSSQQEPVLIGSDDQDSDFGLGQHSADHATDLFLRDRNLALQRNAEDLIAQIDAALSRLNQGSYGICERCGQPIPEERLEARPYAAYCIACQSLVESAAAT
jgi:DnaK suppressor protein